MNVNCNLIITWQMLAALAVGNAMGIIWSFMMVFVLERFVKKGKDGEK